MPFRQLGCARRNDRLNQQLSQLRIWHVCLGTVDLRRRKGEKVMPGTDAVPIYPVLIYYYSSVGLGPTAQRAGRRKNHDE